MAIDIKKKIEAVLEDVNPGFDHTNTKASLFALFNEIEAGWVRHPRGSLCACDTCVKDAVENMKEVREDERARVVALIEGRMKVCTEHGAGKNCWGYDEVYNQALSDLKAALEVNK